MRPPSRAGAIASRAVRCSSVRSSGGRGGLGLGLGGVGQGLVGRGVLTVWSSPFCFRARSAPGRSWPAGRRRRRSAARPTGRGRPGPRPASGGRSRVSRRASTSSGTTRNVLHARPRLLLHPGGHHGVERLAPRAGVVRGHPPRQLEHRRVDQGRVVEHVEDVLDPPRVDPVVQLRVDPHAVADGRRVPPAQRHPHPRPDLQSALHRRRHPVGEDLLDRPVQDHARERAVRPRRRTGRPGVCR